VLQLTAYYPRRSKKSMGAMGKKMSYFLLTQYADNYFGIYQNNIIKMWDKIIFLEFALIILLIGQIFLMSSSDLVSIFSTTVGLLHYSLDPWLLAAIIPIKIYSNAEADKSKILKENKNKSGIYSWKNLINKKQYIGSAIDLSEMLYFYYSAKAMENKLKNSKSSIYNAILKYGHSNFSLTILEYCSPEQCIQREDFYLSSLPHEYNILEKAGSTLGSTRNNTGENNPMYGKKHTEESKTKISDAMVGNTNNKNPPTSQKIEVLDKDNNKTTTYESIRAAARALNINKSVIDKYFSNNQQKPYKGKYTFTKTK